MTWIFSEGGLERRGACGAGMFSQLYGANVQQFVPDASLTRISCYPKLRTMYHPGYLILLLV
uniref:Uncharacterized protein n=1 Tax=Aegilops tauschii subsp. strangulata TaxID=200361 RepID=A0A453NT36_AEGTS